MKISDFVLHHANADYFLPSIQREFVWFDNMKQQKVEKLFDSLLQEYPIGNILTWKYEKDIKKDHLEFEVYDFITSWNDKDSHNKPSNLNGKSSINLVLDGQQRLTSLLIGLNGIRNYTKNGKSKSEKLYINLFSNIETDKKNIYGWKYELKFLEDSEAENDNNKNKLWIAVGKVLDYRDKTTEDFKQSLSDIINIKANNNTELIKKANNTLGQMHTVFCHDEKISEEFVYKKDVEGRKQVLDIFERINQTGTQLAKSDMLLSNMESNKSLFQSFGGAKKEINRFIDELNKEKVNRPSYDLKKDFVLKASLVLSDLEIQYRLENFNEENLKKISDNWINIKKYLMITTELIGRYNFSKKNVIAKNALIPISYYLMYKKTDNSFVDSTKKDDDRMKDSIIRWLSTAMLEGLLGSSSDTTLAQIRSKIKDETSLEDTLEHPLNKDQIKKIVDNSRLYESKTRLILMLVCEQKYWEFSEDHLFAKKYFEKDHLKKLNFDDKTIEKFQLWSDGIGNLELIPSNINLKKSAEGFIEWSDKQNENYKAAFLIPTMDDYSLSNFEEFVKKRNELIVEKLSKILEAK